MPPAATAISREPVAVVGMGALYPGGGDLRSYWHTIISGDDRMQQVPASYWLPADFFSTRPGALDRIYTDRGAFIAPVDIDVLDTGVTPRDLASTDISQLLALHLARQLLQQSGFLHDNAIKRRTSVILGVSGATEMMSAMSGRLGEPVWRHALREAGLSESQSEELVQRMLDYFPAWQETTFPGLLGNVIAGRIANRLDLHGTNCVVDAACASSFSALSMALNELYLQQADLVLTGGVDALNHPLLYLCFARTGALSRSGDCRPFSAQADGTMMGEGVGLLALRRLADAERDGNTIHAVIRACGSSSDGLSKSVYAPVAAGQAMALQRAYQAAGYSPRTVELMEAHGTATVAGDAAEFSGLNQVFGAARELTTDSAWCALGSVKSQIGHTKGAAGAAGLIKTILALQHKVLPPTIKVEQLNPKLAIDGSPFYLNTRPRPWVRDKTHPRRAAVSALGFGGSNFHVTVEEYTGTGKRAPRLAPTPVVAVLLGADDTADALQQCQRLRAQGWPAGSLQHLAYITQRQGIGDRPLRLVILAADESQWQTRLQQAIAMLQRQQQDTYEVCDDDVFLSCGLRAEQTALLFSGQGSQYVGMGAELAMFAPQAQAVWDRAADVLGGAAPHHAVFPPPALLAEQRQRQEDFLRQPEQAQPALAASALAQWRLLQALDLQVEALAGHSFGEVTALHVAGAFDDRALFNIAATRGRLMAEAAAARPGAMSAVIGDSDLTRRILAAAADEICIANDNSPRQLVISGDVDAVQRAEQALQQHALRVVRLPVATAFHSPLVAGASTPFAAFLQAIRCSRPTLPVIACASARAYPAGAAKMRAVLAQQLAQPVRFRAQIEQLYAQGVRNFIELGAGNVLARLVDECLGARPHRALAADRKDQHGVLALYRLLARLTIAGNKLQWRHLWDGMDAPPDPAAQAKPKLSKAVAGHNLDRPYPPPAGAANLHAPMASFNPPPPAVTTPRDTTMNHSTPTAQPSPAAAAPAATTTSPAATGDAQAALLAAQQQFQASMLAMQQAMTDAHLSYLQTVQRMLGLAAAPVIPAATPAPAAPTPMAVSAPPTVMTPPTLMTPPPAPAPIAAPATSPVSTGGQAASPPPAAATMDLTALFLDVVADKTGYPRQVLDLDMEMESGLGIDSIKRVEILAEMQRQLPALADLDAMHLASLATLRDVVDSIELLNHDTPQAPAAPAPTAAPQARTPPLPARDLATLFLDIVADKTGYPRQVLDLDMEMESGLGIDSIKRVEILAELQKQVPALAQVDAMQLATLSTLREVVNSVQQTADAGSIVVQAIARARHPEKKTPEQAPYRHVVRLIDQPASGFVTPGLLHPGTLVISGDADGIAARLAARLTAGGLRVQCQAQLREVPADLCGLIVLHGLQAADSAAAGMALQLSSLQDLQQAAGALQSNQGFVLLVTAGDGAFGLTGRDNLRPWGRGLVALARTAALEWPTVCCRYLDCDARAANLAQVVNDELWQGGDSAEIAIAGDGRRHRLVDSAQATVSGDTVLPADGVLLVSGGGRGVTAACLLALAQKQRLRFALLGRSQLLDAAAGGDAGDEKALLARLSSEDAAATAPQLRQRARAILASREIHQTLRQLQAAGSSARYYTADTTDAAAVAGAVQEIRRDWGEIHGLIHAAGVLADKRIIDKKPQQAAAVLGSKLQGMENLLAAAGDDPLRLIVMFSSVAARYGNTGQCDYAMANETLNQLALALATQRPACRVKSLLWGPWDGGMVRSELKQHFSKQGIALIDLVAGAQWFADEIRQPADPLVILGRGGRLAARQREPSTHYDIAVDLRRLPHLRDHVIKDSVVLPVVQIIEWFLGAVSQWQGGDQQLQLQDLQVLAGIKLDRHAEQTSHLRIELDALPAGRWQALLRDAQGKPCYRALVTREAPPDFSAGDFAQASAALSPWTLQRRRIYGKQALFHGPAFQVIEQLIGISDDGCALRLRAGADRQWHGAPFISQPALLDGCLQALVLWEQQRKQRQSLPTGIERIWWLQATPAVGPVTCRARIQAQPHHTLSDILVVDAQQRPVVALQGVNSVAYAALSQEA